MAVPTATDTAQQAAQTPKKGAKKAAETAQSATQTDQYDEQTEDGTAEYEDEYEDDDNAEGGDVANEAQDQANGAKDKLNGSASNAQGKANEMGEALTGNAGAKAADAKESTEDTAKDAAGTAKDTAENAAGAGDDDDTEEVVPVGKVTESGDILSNDGSDRVIGSVTSGDPKSLFNKNAVVDNEGDVIDPESGDVLAAGTLDKLTGAVGDVADKATGVAGDAVGTATDAAGGVADTATGAVGDVADTAGGAAGDVVDTAKGAVDQLPLLQLDGPVSFDTDGVKDSAGNLLGQLTEGDPTSLAKEEIKGITENGDILKSDGSVLGKVDLKDTLKAGDTEEKGEEAQDGHATGEEQSTKEEGAGDDQVAQAGEAAEGEQAEGEQAGSEEVNPEVLYRMTVNNAGKIVNENGEIYGEVIEGDVKKLVGRTIEDKEGQIWEGGKVIGKARAFPEDERQLGGESPFESFPEAKVRRDGSVVSDGEVVGKVKEGDLKSLEGKQVAADGSIYDSRGNRIGYAERLEDEEPEEPEPEKDQSALAGKRVNKSLNVVDDKGSIFGKVVEGGNDTIGRMCDGKGNIYNEAGEVIGRAEVVPESQREPAKEGPFANYEGAVVRKDGMVVYNDEVVGRITSGDVKALTGYKVDADGDVLDANGNTLGHAERYEEEEEEKHSHPCAGYKLSAGGFVIDSNGNTIGKLTDGKLDQCKGLVVDDDGDIKNNKGQTIGHVTPIEDVQEDEGPPEKTQEELDAEKQAAEDEENKKNDARLARRLAYVIENGIEDIKPILTDITNKIEHAEATPENERDEEKLVKDVKPLIEEASTKLEDVNKDIRSLDPDGRLQEQAKRKAAEGEASPEEQRVATLLKELTGSVKRTIDNSKKKLNGMPHAKEGINPLWQLLEEPLFQIIAAVGLLLSGVVGLLGKILGGLGLGGIVDNLLGGLGVKNVLGGLTGGGGKKKGGGGGLGGLLG